MHLAKKGLDVTGVEFAPSAVAKAEKLARENGVAPRFFQSNFYEWDWPTDTFDISLGLFFQFGAGLNLYVRNEILSHSLRQPIK